jgi:hypothetical protein
MRDVCALLVSSNGVPRMHFERHLFLARVVLGDGIPFRRPRTIVCVAGAAQGGVTGVSPAPNKIITYGTALQLRQLVHESNVTF